mmetsp:Transcript_48210/g.97067  ORF Transcript_48210/g.97067 Transcript_48210/m.97067 type:complete len:81 (-) Transcript_48210:472-714(-)
MSLTTDSTDAISDDGERSFDAVFDFYLTDPLSFGIGVVSFISLFILVWIFVPCGSRRSSKDEDYEVEGGMRTKVRHEGGI